MVVITTGAAPALPAGTVTVTDVDPAVVMVAGCVATLTVAVVRWVPSMTTPGKPVRGPLFGATEVIVGGAT
jgi:hypothetical protein